MGKIDELRAKVGANVAESGKVSVGTAAAAGPPAARPVPPRNRGVERTRDLCRIDLDAIEPDPDQPRKKFKTDEIDELARSLADPAQGQLVPILVRWDDASRKYRVIDGEKRLRAAIRAREGGASVGSLMAVVFERELSPPEVLEWQLVANGLRSDVEPIEKARAIRRLMDEGNLKQADMAGRLKISQGSVSKLLAMLKAAPAVQAKVSAGKISRKAAVEIARVGPESQVALAEQVEAGSLTAEETAAAAAPARKAKARARAAGKGGAGPRKKAAADKLTSKAFNHDGIKIEARRTRGFGLPELEAAAEAFLGSVRRERELAAAS